MSNIIECPIHDCGREITFYMEEDRSVGIWPHLSEIGGDCEHADWLNALMAHVYSFNDPQWKYDPWVIRIEAEVARVNREDDEAMYQAWKEEQDAS